MQGLSKQKQQEILEDAKNASTEAEKIISGKDRNTDHDVIDDVQPSTSGINTTRTTLINVTQEKSQITDEVVEITDTQGKTKGGKVKHSGIKRSHQDSAEIDLTSQDDSPGSKKARSSEDISSSDASDIEVLNEKTDENICDKVETADNKATNKEVEVMDYSMEGGFIRDESDSEGESNDINQTWKRNLDFGDEQDSNEKDGAIESVISDKNSVETEEMKEGASVQVVKHKPSDVLAEPCKLSLMYCNEPGSGRRKSLDEAPSGDTPTKNKPASADMKKNKSKSTRQGPDSDKVTSNSSSSSEEDEGIKMINYEA